MQHGWVVANVWIVRIMAVIPTLTIVPDLAIVWIMAVIPTLTIVRIVPVTTIARSTRQEWTVRREI